MAKNTVSTPIKDGVKADNSTYSSNQIERRIQEALGEQTITFPDVLIADQKPYMNFTKTISTMEEEVKVVDLFTASKKCKLIFSTSSSLYCNVSSNDGSLYIYKNNEKLGGIENITTSTYISFGSNIPVNIELEAGDTVSLWGKVSNIGSHSGNAQMRYSGMFGAI